MNKRVVVLAVLAISAVGLGVWLSQSPSNASFEAKPLFDNIQKHAHKVDSVEITNAQGVLFKAQKLAGRWLATFDPEQDVYPISQKRLADFVGTMIHAKLVEAKTRKSQNYSRLGLQPIDIDDSMATLVILKAGDNSWQVLVGNKTSLGEGHYIRKPDDSQSWRTDTTIRLPIDKFSWLKQPILPFQAQDINSISRVDDIDWKIARTAGGDLQLLNLPKNRELQYDGILNSIMSNLTSLNFEQLLPIDENFSGALTLLTQLEVGTADNKVFQVMVTELDDKYFVNFTSRHHKEYWQKWYYQISHFSAQQLIKTTEDFLADPKATSNISVTKQQAVDEGDAPN